MLALQALFAIIKLQSHKQQGMGTIKMIGRLYQLGDRRSHLRAGQPQSIEGVSVGVGLVGGPNPCLMFPETESREEGEVRPVLCGDTGGMLPENLMRFQQILSLICEDLGLCVSHIRPRFIFH